MQNQDPNVEGLFNYNDIDAIQAKEHAAIMELENKKRQREKEKAEELERQRLEALRKFQNLEQTKEQEVTNIKQKTVIKLRAQNDSLK